jgi:hypothetical protein
MMNIPTPVFAKTLVRACHVRSFEVACAGDAGWEVSLRADETLVERRRYADWHRVERAITRFLREISKLRHDGWVEV